ncbi:MAG: hypothetical protein KBE91_07040, partial [Bacteroidia bacterium]|nr:hypothetical protein [Bacteroidia bacterium]
DPVVTAFVADIMSRDNEVSPNWEKKHDVYIEPAGYNFKEDVDSALLRLKVKHIEKLMKENIEEIEKLEKEGNTEQIDMHIHVQMHLTQKRHDLTRKIETTISR